MFNLPSTEQQQAPSLSLQPAFTKYHKRLGASERLLQRACRLCREGLRHNSKSESSGVMLRWTLNMEKLHIWMVARMPGQSGGRWTLIMEMEHE